MALLKISDPALCAEDTAWLKTLQHSIMPEDDMFRNVASAATEDGDGREERPVPTIAPNLLQKKKHPKLNGPVQMKIRRLEERAFTKLAHHYAWLRKCQELLDGHAVLPLLIRHHHNRGRNHPIRK
jgi:hypothetical protein